METSALPEKTMTVSKEEINHSHTAIKRQKRGYRSLIFNRYKNNQKFATAFPSLMKSKQKPIYSGK